MYEIWRDKEMTIAKELVNGENISINEWCSMRIDETSINREAQCSSERRVKREQRNAARGERATPEREKGNRRGETGLFVKQVLSWARRGIWIYNHPSNQTNVFWNGVKRELM